MGLRQGPTGWTDPTVEIVQVTLLSRLPLQSLEATPTTMESNQCLAVCYDNLMNVLETNEKLGMFLSLAKHNYIEINQNYIR
jgi:hypothetical protein